MHLLLNEFQFEAVQLMTELQTNRTISSREPKSKV